MKDAKKVVDLWENDLVFDPEKAAEIAKNEGVEKAIAYSLRIFQNNQIVLSKQEQIIACLLYTSPSPRDGLLSRMPSSA